MNSDAEPVAADTRAPRKCVLVLGMHRSGTSATARAIGALGAALPRNPLPSAPDNAQGYWEPAALVALNDRLLADLGTGWDDWRHADTARLSPEALDNYRRLVADIITQEFGDAQTITLKDPRICRLLPFYLDVLEKLGFEVVPVLVWRNPLAVAMSLNRRAPMALHTAGLLWLRHCLDAEFHTRGLVRAVINYDTLFAEGANALRGVFAAVGLEQPAAATTLDGLDQAMQHHRPTLAALEAEAEIPPWVKIAAAILGRGRLESDRDALAILRGNLAELETLCGALALGAAPDARRQMVEKEKLALQLLAARAEVKALRASTSWQVTAPLRLVSQAINQGRRALHGTRAGAFRH